MTWQVVLDPPGAMLPPGITFDIGQFPLIGGSSGWGLGAQIDEIELKTNTGITGTQIVVPAGSILMVEDGTGNFQTFRTTAYAAYNTNNIPLDRTYTLNADYTGGQVLLPARAPLDLNGGSIQIDQKGIDWGDSATTPYEADLRVGSVSVDSRTPNRIVHIPLLLSDDVDMTEEEARSSLQQKVAVFQQEGGAVMRKRDDGLRMYADIVGATLTLPDVWGETGSIEPDVQLTLECLPDFYGDEITLDVVDGQGCMTAVMQLDSQQAVILGDSDARVRIVVNNTTSSEDQQGLIWGLRSRYYDRTGPRPTSGVYDPYKNTRALFYEAEDLAPVGSAAVATASGFTASPVGSSTDNVVAVTGLPRDNWVSVLLTDLTPPIGSTIPLAHQGSYRVYARIFTTSTPQIRLLWGLADVVNQIANDPVQVPPFQVPVLMDLGQITLETPLQGLGWRGLIQVMAENDNDEVQIDCIYFVPLDEYSGQVRALMPSAVLAVDTDNYSGAVTDDSGVGTVPWVNTSFAQGPPDGNYAEIVAAHGSAQTHYLLFEDFGFDIPSGATITGVAVFINRGRNDTPNTVVADDVVKLQAGGTVVGSNKASAAAWVPGDSSAYYGGPADLWGATLTASGINASNFGLALSVDMTLVQTLGVRVYSAEMIVYYTLSGAFTPDDDAVAYSGNKAELRTEGMYRWCSTSVFSGNFAAPMSLVVGDLPRAPASGMEMRPLELFLKPFWFTPGIIPNTDLSYCLDVDVATTFTAQVIYRPVWTSRP